MKTYMPLNGLRWSRNSGSANCDMPQSAVFGRPGGGDNNKSIALLCNNYAFVMNKICYQHLFSHTILRVYNM